MAEAAISMMLECPICQEQFTEPRVLPCQHTFCLHCLEKIREHQSTTESIPCPVCRATYYLTTAGIDDLPKNIFAANLIDIVCQDDVQVQAGSGSSNTENRQLCTLDTDECSQPATVYCDVCDVYMCEQCELYHKNNKLAKKHKTISVTQVTTRKIKPFCPKHTSIPLDIFCRDCNLIICSSCLTNHEEHKCCGLNSVVDDFSGQLDHVLAQTDESLKAINKAIKVTQEQAVKVKADVTNLKQQTSAAYRAIQRHVEEHEQSHLASIDKYYQQAEKVIAETLDKQETLETVLHSIQLYGQHLSKASAYDLTTNVRSLVKRSKEEVSKSVPELRWKVDLTWSDWKVKGEVDRVALVREGEVNVESDQQMTTVTDQSVTHGDHGVRQMTTVTGQSVTCGDRGVRQLTTVTGQSATRGDHGVRQLNTFTTQCNSDISGMVSYHNHLFIVHFDHNKLYVYDEGGRLKRSVQIGRSCDPYDMCLVQGEGGTHSLVISDCAGQCLWWLTTEKQAGDVKLGHPQQHKLQYRPWGVSTARSGRAVVADCGNRRVCVYSHPGRVVTCLQLSGDVKPHQALTDQSDGYVVRHGWPVDQLLWVNSAGQVTRSYTDQPAVCAHHIVDDGTCLLVSDPLNHCVHIVTREGRHDGHLITDIDPTSVCLDPAGRRLWVAYNGKDNKRHVMEMSYTPQSSRVTSSVTSCDTSPVTSPVTYLTSCDASPITSPVTSTPIVSLTLKVTLPKIT